MSGKKVSDTFRAKHPKGESLAKGVGHLFSGRSLVEPPEGNRPGICP